MTDSLDLDWDNAQSLPPTRSYVVQVARNILDFKRGMSMELHCSHEDYARVVARGPEFQIPPEAIKYARKLLEEAAAANRGHAARWLKEADDYLTAQAERQRAQMAS